MNTQEIDLLVQTQVDLQLTEQALDLAKKRAKWNAVRSHFAGLCRDLQELGIENVALNYDFDVSFTGDKNKLEQVWHAVRQAGFELADPTHRPKAGESSWSGYFHKPGVNVDVWLFFTSSVCRRVKTGTKLVEQDVYETICGEDVPAVEVVVPEITHAAE